MNIKKVGICFFGAFVSIFLLSIFVYANLYFTEASEFAKPNYVEQMMKSPNENPFERLQETIWRFDFIFYPIIFILSAFIISILDRSKYKSLITTIALLPLTLLYLFAGGFAFKTILFASSYLILALLVTFLINPRVGIKAFP
jgi:hypothetical protein